MYMLWRITFTLHCTCMYTDLLDDSLVIKHSIAWSSTLLSLWLEELINPGTGKVLSASELIFESVCLTPQAFYVPLSVIAMEPGECLVFLLLFWLPLLKCNHSRYLPSCLGWLLEEESLDAFSCKLHHMEIDPMPSALRRTTPCFFLYNGITVCSTWCGHDVCTQQ